MSAPTSIAILAYFGGEPGDLIATAGEGESKVTLWRSSGGRQAIETNGDAILDTDEQGFRDAVVFWPGFKVREQPEGDRWELVPVTAANVARAADAYARRLRPRLTRPQD